MYDTMSLFDSIILGIIEGVTEFLPISSTGHLILASSILGIAESEFLKTFEISIQLGAILAVVVLYWRTLTTSVEVWRRILIAFLPTAVLGLVFYKTVKNLLGSEELVLWTLFLGGVFIIGFEMWNKKPVGNFPSSRLYPEGSDAARHENSPPVFIDNLTLSKAFIIGLFQSVAMIPGVSRSAATIVGGLLLGMERKAIVEFSFLLAIPTMLAATGLDLFKNAGAFSVSDFSLLAVGFIVSFLTAFIAVKTFLRFIECHSFIAFGVYRILAAGIFFLFFF